MHVQYMMTGVLYIAVELHVLLIYHLPYWSNEVLIFILVLNTLLYGHAEGDYLSFLYLLIMFVLYVTCCITLDHLFYRKSFIKSFIKSIFVVQTNPRLHTLQPRSSMLKVSHQSDPVLQRYLRHTHRQSFTSVLLFILCREKLFTEI